MENGPMECWTVAFSPDGQKIISGSNAGKIHVYNVETGQQEEQLDTRGKYTLSIAYVRNAIFLKKIYNEYQWYFLHQPSMIIAIMSNIFQSPDGKYVASGAIDGIINVFDVESSKLMHTLEGHAMPIRSLTFSPDSQRLLTGSDDCHMKIYDV